MQYQNEDKRIASNTSREALMPFASPWSPNRKNLLNIKMKTKNVRAKYENQITPMHDFLNFKDMTGNEILINMQFSENMTVIERLNCLIAL